MISSVLCNDKQTHIELFLNQHNFYTNQLYSQLKKYTIQT